MRTIYLDSDFKCHVTNDETLRAIQTSCFDGKKVKEILIDSGCEDLVVE